MENSASAVESEWKPSSPQKEHEWLKQLLGEWTCVTECQTGPDKPPMKSTGTERVRALGGLWVMAEGESEMPGGGTSQAVITLGFDPQKGKFVGTFVASVMSNLWVYEGSLDESGTVLTLDTEGPAMSGNGMGKYQDIIELSDGKRVLRSQMLGEDGKWIPFMTATYERKG